LPAYVPLFFVRFLNSLIFFTLNFEKGYVEFQEIPGQARDDGAYALMN